MRRIPGKFLESGLRRGRAGRGAREAGSEGGASGWEVARTLGSGDRRLTLAKSRRLCGSRALGFPPLKHEPFLPQPPTLRGSRTVRAGAPGARPQDPSRPEPGSLRQVPLAKPEGSARRGGGPWPGRAAGCELGSGGLPGLPQFRAPRESSSRGSAPTGLNYLLSRVSSRSREIFRAPPLPPTTTALQIYNPNNLISRSSPPASALAPPPHPFSFAHLLRRSWRETRHWRAGVSAWGGEGGKLGDDPWDFFFFFFVCLWRRTTRLLLRSAEPVASPGISFHK